MLTQKTKELICELLRKEFDQTKDFEFDRRTLIIEATSDIGCFKEHIEMIKDDLIPSEKK